MDTVYKFCGKHGLEILRNLELKVTPPNQFNDPFEFTPKMVCSDPVGYAKRLEREPVLKQFYEMCRSQGEFLGSFHAFREIAKTKMPEWTAILAKAPQHTLPLGEKKFLDEVSKRHGVLCMSGRRDSVLMWGGITATSALGLPSASTEHPPFFSKKKD